jgi:cysteine protease ATG4
LDPTVPPLPQESELVKTLEWDTGLLLLVPLRLGLDKFHDDYVQSVAHTFRLPQSVGILGGRPRGARWFYGAYSDGSKVLGLDPHTVQSAPRRRRIQAGLSSKTIVDLSEDYLRSVHTTYPEVFPIHKMDPSIALGFYCRDKKDFAELETALQHWKEVQGNAAPELFTFCDKAPDYMSSAMKNMMLMDGGLGDDDGDDADQESDDDEYVML